MNVRTKRRLGTTVAITSLLMAVAVSGIWWRSLFAADLVQHFAPTTVNGQYARRNWMLLSSAGFFEIGRTVDVPITPARAVQVKSLDEQTGFGWSCALPEESVEGNPWGIFCNSLKRLSFYSMNENHSWLVSSGRYLEVPYALPFIAFLIAPVTAIIRRRLRIRRSGPGFAPIAGAR
jgi:hypothetical protein